MNTINANGGAVRPPVELRAAPAGGPLRRALQGRGFHWSPTAAVLNTFFFLRNTGSFAHAHHDEGNACFRIGAGKGGGFPSLRAGRGVFPARRAPDATFSRPGLFWLKTFVL